MRVKYSYNIGWPNIGWGLQEYIARDVNNIALVEDVGNIVSIEGNIFLYSPKKSHPILLLLVFIQGFVCHLTI